MKSANLIVCVILAAVTLLVFSQSLHNGFVHFDDDGYVLENSAVREGLSTDSIRYAFTTLHLGNWIPVTWLSYELNVALHGIRPEAFHLTDLGLHVLNVLLIFEILRRSTGSLGRSAIVAALWGLHPLRVESVSWIAERKDVLSTFFMLLAILCYERFEFTRKRSWYAGLVVAFLLGLMSKSMLVTLPVLLIGLDVWPLNRVAARTATEGVNPSEQFSWWTRQLFEKGPLLVISLIFGFITIMAQKSQAALVSIGQQSVLNRGLHAVESYGWYLVKTVFPVDLVPYYPLDSTRHDWSLIATGGLFIIGIGVWAFVRRRTQPWLMAGMVWFLVSLLPVIGIIQVGDQAYADRYSYVPSIGLLLLVVWEVSDWLDRLPRGMTVKAVLTVVTLLFLSVLTSLQVGYWFDARSLWSHAIELNSENWLAHFHMGRLALRENDGDAALLHFSRVLEIRPRYADAHLMIAAIHQHRRNWDAAQIHYRSALDLQPDKLEATFNLGVVARSMSRFDEARTLFEDCLQRPEFAGRVYLELGHLEVEQGQLEQGLSQFEAAIRAEPQLEMGYEYAATVCEKMSRPQDAQRRLEIALQTLPRSTLLRTHLAQLLHSRGEKGAAIAQLRIACELNPGNLPLRQMLESVESSSDVPQ